MDEGGELCVVFIGSDNGTAGASELRGSADRAGSHDHATILFGDMEDTIAEVEVGVHKFCELEVEVRG